MPRLKDRIKTGWEALPNHCSNCKFFFPENPITGRCLRHSPTVLGVNISTFPIVNRIYWCGDWEFTSVAK
jgi:hypothetical protein